MRHLMCLSLLLSCSTPAPPARELDVWMGGCEAWQGGRCLLAEPGDLHLWFEAPSTPAWSLQTGTDSLRMDWDATSATWRLTWLAEPNSTPVLRASDGGRGPGVTIASWARPVAFGDELPEDASARADAAEGLERARWLSVLARRTGAMELLGEATSLYLAHDAPVEAVKDAALQAYLQAQAGEGLDAARRLLDEVGQDLPRVAEAHAYLAWATGVLEARVGRIGAAIDAVRRQVELAEAAGHAGMARDARSEEASLLQLAGRHAEALEVHRRLVDGAGSHEAGLCDRARYLNNLGWALLVARERGAQPLGTDDLPTPWLMRALEALDEDCTDEATLEADVRLNLALAAASEGDLGGAASWVDRAGPWLADLSVEQRLVMHDLAARVALDAHRLEGALEAYEAMEREAESSGRVHEVWRAEHGQARVLEALERPDEALEHYVSAQRGAASLAGFVPVTLGRDAFLAQREVSARDHVALLLEQGSAAEALDVVRDLRAWFVASLRQAARLEQLTPVQQAEWDHAVGRFHALRREGEALQRDAWKRRDTEVLEAQKSELQARTRRLLDDSLPFGGAAPVLRTPEAGERMLAWFKDRQGWVGFAASSDEVVARRLVLPDSDAPAVLGPALFGPLAEAMTGATRITLLPYGRLRGVDLQLLPAPEALLVQLAPVTWALDLGPSSDPAVKGQVLVVSDPRGDLPWARREGARVQETLRSPSVVHLSGDAATREALLEYIPASDVLHFAGHGAFGEGVWDGELLTARHGRFTVADVLSLPSVPARVVLSGCETARTRDTALENLGIAQAFIATGSLAAVASVRRVDDALAAAFSEALYEAGFAEGAVDQAFRRATLTVRASMPEADVGAFRLITP